MKTRSQTQQAIVHQTQRIFLISEKNGGNNGWTVIAENPMLALEKFKKEVKIDTVINTIIFNNEEVTWDEYLKIEHGTTRPCYMSVVKIGNLEYYIELLTNLGSSVGWVPTDFFSLT